MSCADPPSSPDLNLCPTFGSFSVPQLCPPGTISSKTFVSRLQCNTSGKVDVYLKDETITQDGSGCLSATLSSEYLGYTLDCTGGGGTNTSISAGTEVIVCCPGIIIINEVIHFKTDVVFEYITVNYNYTTINIDQSVVNITVTDVHISYCDVFEITNVVDVIICNVNKIDFCDIGSIWWDVPYWYIEPPGITILPVPTPITTPIITFGSSTQVLDVVIGGGNWTWNSTGTFLISNGNWTWDSTGTFLISDGSLRFPSTGVISTHPGASFLPPIITDPSRRPGQPPSFSGIITGEIVADDGGGLWMWDGSTWIVVGGSSQGSEDSLGGTPDLTATPTWHKIVLNYTDLAAPSTTKTVNIMTLPAKAVVHDCILTHTANFTTGTTPDFADYRIMIGDSSDPSRFALGNAMMAIDSPETNHEHHTRDGRAPHSYARTGTQVLQAMATDSMVNLDQAVAGTAHVFLLLSIAE